MMKSKHINWVIQKKSVQEERRYCHNCGQRVVFRDSLVRRQNANGKNIHHFAIYKCERGHTWNKKIDQFKAIEHLENKRVEFNSEEKVHKNCEIVLETLIREGYKILEITVESTEKIRVDKLLSKYILDQSRTQLSRFFSDERVTVNDKVVSGCYKICHVATIVIKL